MGHGVGSIWCSFLGGLHKLLDSGSKIIIASRVWVFGFRVEVDRT